MIPIGDDNRDRLVMILSAVTPLRVAIVCFLHHGLWSIGAGRLDAALKQSKVYVG